MNLEIFVGLIGSKYILNLPFNKNYNVSLTCLSILELRSNK
jgi:hypothetical protein